MIVTLFFLGCSMVITSGGGIITLFVDRKQEIKRVSAEGCCPTDHLCEDCAHDDRNHDVPQVIIDRLEKGRILFVDDTGIHGAGKDEPF